MIMFVIFETLLCYIFSELVFILEHAQYLSIYWYSIYPNNQPPVAARALGVTLQIKPGMLPDVCHFKSLLGVSAENTLQEFSGLPGHEPWNLEIASKNLLVKSCGVGVFKGKVAAD
jgi:hypothetical protein